MLPKHVWVFFARGVIFYFITLPFRNADHFELTLAHSIYLLVCSFLFVVRLFCFVLFWGFNFPFYFLRGCLSFVLFCLLELRMLRIKSRYSFKCSMRVVFCLSSCTVRLFHDQLHPNPMMLSCTSPAELRCFYFIGNTYVNCKNILQKCKNSTLIRGL